MNLSIHPFWMLLFIFLALSYFVYQRFDHSSDVIIDKFEFEGHAYLNFKPFTNYPVSVIHDPNCECHKKGIVQFNVPQIYEDENAK